MRLREFAPKMQEQAVAKWLELDTAYRKWKEKPSSKKWCKMALFFLKAVCTALVKAFIDWLLRH